MPQPNEPLSPQERRAFVVDQLATRLLELVSRGQLVLDAPAEPQEQPTHDEPDDEPR